MSAGQPRSVCHSSWRSLSARAAAARFASRNAWSSALRLWSRWWIRARARFFDRFDQAYYLKPIGSGRGWLFRVYGEPWQLFRQTREDLELAETYEARPTPAECVERLKRP